MRQFDIHRSLHAMGTRLDIVFPDYQPAQIDIVYQSICQVVAQLEQEWSNYDKSSTISQVNDAIADKGHAVLTTNIYDTLHQLMQLSRLTKGCFNCLGGKKYQSFKSLSKIDAQNSHHIAIPTLDDIQFISSSSSVRAANGQVAFDSGGFGKGLALNHISAILNNNHISNALISFGESSILVKGHHPMGEYWPIGIPHYYKANTFILEMNLNDAFVSVSGHHPEHESRYKKGHILNPNTGEAVDPNRIAVVSGSDGMVTEVLSTAILCADEKAWNEIGQNFPDYTIHLMVYEEDKSIKYLFKSQPDEAIFA